jgi:hypothetical protein
MFLIILCGALFYAYPKKEKEKLLLLLFIFCEMNKFYPILW